MKPLRGMAAVYLREMLILRRRILKQFASWLVSPLLYLVAFHYAMNDTLVGSRPYADFLLPGLVAMSSMTQSWPSPATSTSAVFTGIPLMNFRRPPSMLQLMLLERYWRG